MILIGQYDSPFVRRVGVALRLYEFRFEHRPWSVWSNADEVARYNPLRRVPVLVLEDGTSLVESSAILDALDDRVTPDRLLLPRSGRLRERGLRICALATGTADKAVSLFYESLLRAHPSEVWLERCRGQIGGALDVLEAERSALSTTWWLGPQLSHADIAVACAVRFTNEAHPGLVEASRWPALVRHAQACEALAVFQEIAQPFTVTVER